MAAPAFNASLVVLLSVLGNGLNISGAALAQWQNSTTSPGAGPIPHTFAATDNLITPPQSPQNAAQMCIIVFPQGSAFGGGAIFTLKGALSDTGYSLGTATNGFLALPVGTAVVAGAAGAFYLTSTSQVEGLIFFL